MNDALSFRRALLSSILVGLGALGPVGCGDDASSGGSGGSGGSDGGAGGTTGTNAGGDSSVGGASAGGANAGGAGGAIGDGGAGGASGQEDVERCFTTAVACPAPADAAAVFGSCTDTAEYITAWLSGPTEVNGQCCYQVDVTAPNNANCVAIGRPLMIDERPQVARVGTGSVGWREARAPEVASLGPEVREALAREWARDGAYEHASVASFGKLALELVAFGAPSELVEDAHVAALDEVRHAKTAFALTSAYGGVEVGPLELPALRRLELAQSLEELAAAAVLEGCYGETLAAAALYFAAERAVDPVVRAILRTTAAEESRHAALAYRVVKWAIREGGAPVRDAARVAASRALAMAEAAVEGPAEGASDDNAVTASLAAHGRLSAKEQARENLSTARDVVRPALVVLFGGREN
ncbi:MAG: hypothetical protein U0271_09015 [Polyangiaceae bacterium]